MSGSSKTIPLLQTTSPMPPDMQTNCRGSYACGEFKNQWAQLLGWQFESGGEPLKEVVRTNHRLVL